MQQLYIEHTNIHIITKHRNINKYKNMNIYIYIFMYDIYIVMFVGFVSVFTFFVGSKIATSFGNTGKIPRPQYPELIMTTPFN